MPVDMNTTTANRERLEKRANPQMPWPLVQPLPMRVPMPTSRPATISHGHGNPLRATLLDHANQPPAAMTSPARNASRQPRPGQELVDHPPSL